jgi:conjugative transfer signal peptidase TraF
VPIPHSIWSRAGAFGCGFAAILALLCASHDPHNAMLVWNATASAPIGLYRVLPEKELRRGDLVLVKPPDWVQRFASARHYLPAHIPLVKRVAALAGQTICARNDAVLIDGAHVATRLRTDSLGRNLPAWHGCRILDGNEVFLLMKDVRTSFDGRYFGVVSASSVIGRLQPLWTH